MFTVPADKSAPAMEQPRKEGKDMSKTKQTITAAMKTAGITETTPKFGGAYISGVGCYTATRRGVCETERLGYVLGVRAVQENGNGKWKSHFLSIAKLVAGSNDRALVTDKWTAKVRTFDECVRLAADFAKSIGAQLMDAESKYLAEHAEPATDKKTAKAGKTVEQRLSELFDKVEGRRKAVLCGQYLSQCAGLGEVIDLEALTDSIASWAMGRQLPPRRASENETLKAEVARLEKLLRQERDKGVRHGLMTEGTITTLKGKVDQLTRELAEMTARAQKLEGQLKK